MPFREMNQDWSARCGSLPEVDFYQLFQQHANVIYVSSVSDDLVRQMHMHPAHSMEEALALAEYLLQKTDASITVIPDGVSVISCVE